MPGKAGARYYKNVGLGFKTPREAIEGEPPRPPRAAAAARRVPAGAAQRCAGREGLGLHGSRAAARRAAAARARRLFPRAATLTALAPAAGTYVDHKCPFTSDVSIRGRILTGTVRSAKMKRTIIIRRDYMHYIKKYQRCAGLSARRAAATRPAPGCSRVTPLLARPLRCAAPIARRAAAATPAASPHAAASVPVARQLRDISLR